MARQLKRIIKDYWGDALIDEKTEDTLVMALQSRQQLAAVPWRRVDKAAWLLQTPYGKLTIGVHMGHCRYVQRHGCELIHCSTGKPVMFRSVAAAKVAAIYHLKNGFEDWPHC